MSYRHESGKEEPPTGTGELEPQPPNWVVSETQDDLLVAVQSCGVPRPAPVQMNFHHAFSRVIVKARIKDDDYNKNGLPIRGNRIKVTRVDLINLFTYGKLTLDDMFSPLASVPGSGTSVGAFTHNGSPIWGYHATKANYHLQLISTVIPADVDYVQLQFVKDVVFVIPQKADSDAAIYVEYNIYDYSVTQGERYIKSASRLFSIKDLVFEMEKSYALCVELDCQ
jgi:hypothetical protein